MTQCEIRKVDSTVYETVDEKLAAAVDANYVLTHKLKELEEFHKNANDKLRYELQRSLSDQSVLMPVPSLCDVVFAAKGEIARLKKENFKLVKQIHSMEAAGGGTNT